MPTQIVSLGALALTCSLIAAPAESAAQTVRYVGPTPAGTGDGLSWANRSADLYATLQTANTFASPTTPQEVWVAAGTYTTLSGSSRAMDRDLSFEIGPYVQLLGGFSGSETNKIQASPTTNVTTLSGDIDGGGTLAGNSYNVVVCDNCKVNAGLDGFTVTGGNANKGGGFDARGRAGAGIFLFGESGRQANLIITRCVVTGNAAEGFGGGIYAKGLGGSGESSPVIERTVVSGNTAGVNGGGLYVDGRFGGTSNPKLTEVDILSNATVDGTADGAGGGLYVGCGGGGTANVDLKRVRIQGNATSVTVNVGNTGANGGGVYVAANGGTSNLTLDNVILDANSAYAAGGIYLNAAASATFRNCTVTDNQALGGGGSGGGVYVNASSATLVNHLSWGNSAVGVPGSKDLRFVNGVVTTSYSLYEAPDHAALFSRASTSNADVLNAGAGLIYGQDPQLASPAGYPESGSATSPAVNAGDNASAPASGLDYAGGPRVRQTTVDLGAVETAFAPLPVELVSFRTRAEERYVALTWRTAAEIDLAGYRVERSTDGEQFAELVFVPAMQRGTYGFSDHAVASGETYYYRVVGVDQDGQETASAIESASLGEQHAAIADTLFPNPSAGRLMVNLAGEDGGQRAVYAAIHDGAGRRVRFFALTEDGAHDLDLRGLADGSYVLRLSRGDELQTLRFTVKR